MNTKKLHVIQVVLMGCMMVLGANAVVCQVYWDVRIINSIEDTIFVRVSLSDEPSCGFASCGFTRYSLLTISPCPLESCDDDPFVYSEDDYITIDLKFHKNEKYTLSGYVEYHGAWDGPGPVECGDDCIIEIYPDPRIFPDDYVSVSSSTWGLIKSLYRISLH